VKFLKAIINLRFEGKEMKEVLLALIAGLIVGIIFKFMKLPLPAPPVFSAVVGVFGVYLGGVVASWMVKFFQG
jgi:XapX domain-containing protein